MAASLLLLLPASSLIASRSCIVRPALPPRAAVIAQQEDDEPRGVIRRMINDFDEVRKSSAANIKEQRANEIARRAAGGDAPLGAPVIVGAALASALRIEAVQFCVTFVGAWLTAVGPDVVARLTLAAQAAVAGRACTRPLRLAAEILILRTLLRTLRGLPAAERPTVLRERATQDVALAFTVVATARAVDLWKLGADATVAAIDVLPARAIVEAALAAAAAVAAALTSATAAARGSALGGAILGVLELDARVGALALSAARALAAFVAWTRVIPAANAVRTAVFK